MRKTLKFIWLLLPLVMVGCGPKNLERSRVPIAWGMRMDDNLAESELCPNLALLRSHKMRSIYIELPLVADSTKMPMVEQPIPGHALTLLAKFKVKVHIAFTTTNVQELFPDGELHAPTLWFATLEKHIRHNLDVIKTYPPERVVIGSNLAPAEGYVAEWQGLFERLRKDYKDMFFSYGGRLENLDSTGLGAISDELSIDYPPIAGEDAKPGCRNYNTKIAELAKRLHKPVYIFRANIIGDDPLTQMKNRLRFWTSETRLRGICFNTLYSKLSLRDSTTYCGLQDNPEILEFVQEYRNRGY
jgi:hypothetical protein